jgi:hypothetical protein
MMTAEALAHQHQRIMRAGWSGEEVAAAFQEWNRLWELSLKAPRQKGGAAQQALERTR